jgi:4-hydroxybenzoate polyprenyltransferase
VDVKITGNWLHWTGASIFIGLLIYQHTLVKAEDLSRVNLAFFTMNGIASLIYGTLVITSLYI